MAQYCKGKQIEIQSFLITIIDWIWDPIRCNFSN